MGTRRSGAPALTAVIAGGALVASLGCPAVTSSAAAPASSVTAQSFALDWTTSQQATAACSGAAHLTCHTWTGKVTLVDDGDTVRVDVFGDGTTRTEKVRLVGIQAMEQYTYSKSPSKRSGECHALAATARLEALLKAARWRVRLQSRRVSSASLGRPLRTLQVRRAGVWVDLGTQLVREGHALWQHQPVEHTRDRANGLAEGRARRQLQNLWDDGACGAGPSPHAKLALTVNWDADGNDAAHVNGEFALVVNRGSADVSLAGWWLRDSALRGARGRGYTFPPGTLVKAGRSVVLYAGKGSSTPVRRYWGLTTPPFDNPGAPGTSTQYAGDGAYLFDPEGDLRASGVWPCRTSCTDPLFGKVTISAVAYRGSSEYVDVTNTTDAALALGGYVLSSYPDVYMFGQSTRLAPRGRLRMMINGSASTDSASVLHWGRPAGTTMLNNGGDRVILRNSSTVRLDCTAWGSARC